MADTGRFSRAWQGRFNSHIVDPGFVSHPAIDIARLTEKDDVVVAEGSVRAQRQDGSTRYLAFCDVFEMSGGKIRRLTSYLMETPPAAST